MDTATSRQLDKYLRNRAVATPWQLDGSTGTKFNAAVVVPALAEARALPLLLASLAGNPKDSLRQTLILIVVNHRIDAPEAQKAENRQSLAWLHSDPFPQLELAWVDASSVGLELPLKDGVGLARKIGFDLALPRLDWEKSPLLISLDADTLVEPTYLPAIYAHFSQSRCAGATLPFRHQLATDPQQEQAIRHYELYLRSYLFGLQQAGSPYAFHSIGSAFACQAAAYLKAGGMNRRLAAEDFYFLQQLAKTGGVEMLRGTLVAPSPRFSGRVPFGTGRAVQEQVERGGVLFSFSSVAAFSMLHDWLLLVSDHWDGSAEMLLTRAAAISPVLSDFLQSLKFKSNWAKLQKNHSGRQQFSAAFHCWFDGLRTRQFLIRAEFKSSVAPATDSVGRLLAWGGHPGIEGERQQLLLLEKLQGVG